jgi:molybdopterin synthase catalytic subunit/nucleoside-diphosphate-sugar epimerase
MSSQPTPVRAGRSRKPVIAVTGAASGLGALLTARLVVNPAVRKVIAIDDQRGDTSAPTWRVADVRDPALASKLSGIDVLVHLALDLAVEASSVERRALNVRGTTVALTGAAAAGVKRVVLLTSALVYGSQVPHDGPLGDEAEVLADPDDSVLGDMVEIEAVAQRARRAHPWLEITILRPAPLVGPGIDSVVTRHFEAPRLLVLRGSAPLWQFCHVDDLLSALEVAALGTYLRTANVAGKGWLSQDEVERVSGLRRIELPASVAISTAERLHRIGVTPAAASELSFLVHPLVVTTEALTSAGWHPEYDNEAALEVLLEESARHTALGARRLDRKDATRAAAASATVALVGTAALVRRAHKRRRGGHGPKSADMTVQGPGDPIRLLAIRDTSLSVDEVLTAVADPHAGGVAIFLGVVRDHDQGRLVSALGYSAHPTALQELRTVAEGVVAAYPVCGLAAVHRTGDLAVGDLAVVVAVSCAHRGDAFAAARQLIDDLKTQVPLWKHQRFLDGDAEWVGGS